MQVIASFNLNCSQKPRGLQCHSDLWESKKLVDLFVFSGFWENSHGRRDANQSQQQLSNLSSSRPDALQVRLILTDWLKNLLFLSLADVFLRSVIGVPQERPGRRSCWPACQGNFAIPSRTTTPARSEPAAAALPFSTSSAFTCSALSWYLFIRSFTVFP